MQPAPSLDCVTPAVEAAPEVLEVTRRRDYGVESLWIVLRDSTEKGGRRKAYIYAGPPESAGKVTIRFVWTGMRHPPAAEERVVTALARRVLASVHAACAEGSRSELECVYSDGRRAEACRSAG